MRTRILLLLIFQGLLILGTNVYLPQAAPAPALAAADVFASPIHASCMRVTASECKLHVDPFTIQIASPNRLEAFQLRANGSLLYDFRTDVSNPPAGSYTPSAVRLDFAATCGMTYTVNLLARDSGDASFLNAGQAENITCPEGQYTLLLPLIQRPP